MGALITAKENFHAVSLSGGKDSTCLLLLMIERGLPIDAVIWADTGMEFPEMYGHISKVDEHLYRERGLHITTLRSPKSFEYMMFDEPKQKPSTLENRARFLLMALDRVRQAVGPGFPIQIRMNGDDFTEGGLHLEDYKELARMVESRVDLFNISCGSHERQELFVRTHPSAFLDHGCNVYLAAAIKAGILRGCPGRPGAV